MSNDNTKPQAYLTKEEFRKIVRETVVHHLVKEGVITTDMLPGADGKLSGFAAKVDKFLENTAKEALELADEGDELRRTNFTGEVSVGERNRFLDTMTGKLRAIQKVFANTPLDIHNKLG